MATCVEEVKVEQFQVEVKHPATRVWKALVEEAHVTIVAALSEHFEGVEVVEGAAGEAGSVYLLKVGSNKSTLVQQQHGFTCAKVKYEEIDDANLVAKLRLVEGGALGKLWHSFIHTIKVVADARHPHHAVVHHTLHFQRIGQHHFHHTYKEAAIRASSSIEAYLTANPNTGCAAN